MLSFQIPMEVISMTVLENMHAVLPSLPKNERKAAEYLLKYPHEIQRRSTEVIAQDAGISRSAIVRLCQKLGYQGWSEFKYAYLHEPAPAASAQERNILTRYENIIQQLRQAVTSAQLQTIVQAIRRADRVITLGNYHSGMSAQQMALRLNRSGIDSHFMNDTSQMECYASLVRPSDVVLIFSISGDSLYEPIVEQYVQRGAPVFLITMSTRTTLAKLVTQTVVLPFLSHETCSYLLDDAVTFFLFIELLIEALHETAPENSSSSALPNR